MFSFKDMKRTLIVAEVSANHGRDLQTAKDSIKAAKEAGADAVKFQLYTPDTLTIDCRREHFMIEHPEWGGQSLYDLYKKAHTPPEWMPTLKEEAHKQGILFFATAFDRLGVEELEKIDVPFHKVASFELPDVMLIECMAETAKPVVISTGMATKEEISDAVNNVRSVGDNEIVLLKCVSAYPAKEEDMNLRTLFDIRDSFSVSVGLSDHTAGTRAAELAVAAGICFLEKHFILSKKMKTPDSFFSVDPDGLKDLVGSVRSAERVMGQIKYGADGDQRKSLAFRRSLFAVENIKAGECFSQENVRSIRPGQGIAPRFYKDLLNKRALVDIKRGEPIKENMF